MRYALISVYDKTGVIEFAQQLINLGWHIIATGNTAKLLLENQLPVTEIADYTGFPEMLEGRVKTLHPAIHAGLLARSTPNDKATLAKFNWQYIDLVVVNLYPFAKTIAKADVTAAEAIEQIDIGGVTLIRAAAKNHERVTLISEPNDYAQILTELNQDEIHDSTRKQLAAKGFALTSQYDALIANYLSTEKSNHVTNEKTITNNEDTYQLTLYPIQSLRYGENPHQQAKLYSYSPPTGPLGGKLIQGKELSYNNLLDLDAAWKTVCSFDDPTVAIIKHLSPCGIASATHISTAFQAALASDPISAFGGIIASNKMIDLTTAEAFGNLFIECIAAPDFSAEALIHLSKRSSCRLLKISSLIIEPAYEWRSITQGLLWQSLDKGDPSEKNWHVISQRQPTAEEWQTLRFAWKACQHVKSNAIVFAQGTATVGIGSGQPNRIDCVRIAAQHAGKKSQNAVMASDAFFPFADAIAEAARVGISTIIQPGGSIRDNEVIAAADAVNMAMVFTGVRHFRH